MLLIYTNIISVKITGRQQLNILGSVTVMYLSSGPLPMREKYADECPVLLKPFSLLLP